ncbi:hypothetical protein OKW38_006661 [Paraburkholderia sp. MM5496-R1]|uniref:tyrosine-type recombinase/integrase n=1 Tax=Paraburkholderia sp. MM5496-R1 TaxID=2991065 RepID=UPI003D248B33
MSGRQLHRLSALRIAKEVAPGHYADGGGLYMQIADSGARSWVFRFRLDGRLREMGLGPVSRVSLGEARKLAASYREMVRDQIDPILARREQQRRRLLDISADANVTFREAAEAFICAREPEWRNRKHVQQWGNTLKRYAYPVIGEVRVRDIDTAMIVRILQPIWTKKAETARRVRGRIKAILDAETIMGHRTGSNPARSARRQAKVDPEPTFDMASHLRLFPKVEQTFTVYESSTLGQGCYLRSRSSGATG